MTDANKWSMRKTGKAALYSALACLALGFVFLLWPVVASPAEETRLLENAELDLYSCQLRSGRDCSTALRIVAERQEELQSKLPSPWIWYAFFSLAPFVAIIGTILFAAGKVEERITGRVAPESATVS